MDFEIREATRDDVPAIRRVARESWHATYDDIVGAKTVDSVVDDWYDPERLKRSVARDDGVFVVALLPTDSEIVGFAQAVLGDEADSAAELPRIYVRSDRWGEGVGSALVERLETWLRERGVERLRLVVLADNEVGNAFYESRGFRTIGSRESELGGETYTDYVREKEL